ncbi:MULTISPECIES: epoxide hydrolase family protein [unclassified Methanoculleus]|jgi:microsomal epoxide hydrolase|uniref:Epoxide hydrolase n=1 Tax=Methanoculleus palmolei TaxID=72612 RepID=A0ABD8A8V4_9EURY|nr:epoxide hydrolase family protein [Methanoculleus sp. UBA377]MDD2473002.1 epoxide hydrolase [Methanoculleus sp.]WOX55951.1 epoxide hydrolase [Methanoculleus palmolei]
MEVHPFRIDIPQPVLDDLRDRLSHTRFLDEVEGTGWDYGTNLGYMREIVDYWLHAYDWRARETELNAYPQYRAEIDGLGVHFIHERGRGSDPLPIILTHGWPDSICRYLDLIPMLADPARFGGDPADSFDVIVPSMPGYGFSDRPRERGMTSARVAGLWERLMTDVLGYRRFAAGGGDIGSGVSQLLALAHPESVVGLHLTDIGFFSLGADIPDLSENERRYLDAIRELWMQEGAYSMVQSTKPQTLAYGLNDSPAGLAAWFLEKFRTWSDCDGDIERRFSKDELLTNIMIYWATGTIASSIRIYYENMHALPLDFLKERIDVPVGMAVFPKDFIPPPREWAKRRLNVERWTQMPRGGHFTAMEEPELMAREIRAFFRPLRGSPA